MKKDIEWLREEVPNLRGYAVVIDDEGGKWEPVTTVSMEDIYGLINQLDKLEVLSQEENINIVLDDLKEHIKEQQSLSQNVGLAHTSALNDTHYRQYDYVLECINEYEPSEDLQNLLVPKQELPVIPKFVAEFLDGKEGYALYELLDSDFIYDNHDKLARWLYDNDEKTNREREFNLVLAHIYGYEVETEQKYYVMNNDNRMMLVRMMDGKTITEADPFKLEDMYEGEKKSHRLTEQEIKDYDERYFAFAKPVEEVEK